MAEFLRFLGVVSWLIGAWFLYAGFSMETTVTLTGQDPVANLQLMHVQQINILIGCFAVLEGTVALAASGIMDAIRPAPAPTPSD